MFLGKFPFGPNVIPTLNEAQFQLGSKPLDTFSEI
jgi:hypothetical protein